MTKKLLSYSLMSVLFVFSVIGYALAGENHDSNLFDDVSDAHENYEAIKHLEENNIVEGYTLNGGNEFKPENTVQRDEFIKMVILAGEYELQGLSDCFPDLLGQWSEEIVCEAEHLGLVDGYPDNTFKPANKINFAEASKIIANAFLLEVNESDDENWYHQFVVALELLAAIPTSIDEFAKEVTRAETAEMLYRINTKNTQKDHFTYEDVKVAEENKVKSIYLWEASSDSNKVKVSWNVDGYAKKGVKVVYSMQANPEYPPRDGDKSVYVSDPEQDHQSLYAFDGTGDYYVRVCEYTGSDCEIYSNEIMVYLEADKDTKEDHDKEEETTVESISLQHKEGNWVSWEIDGDAANGVKLIWSMNTDPEYPARDGDHVLYVGDTGSSAKELTAKDGEGLYYVRVCEYLGDSGCGAYSNQIELELSK